MTEPRNPLEVVEEALGAVIANFAAELDSRYELLRDHPAMCRRYDRDMEVVNDARAALALVRKMRADVVVGWVEDGSLWGLPVVEALGNDMAADGHVFLYQTGGVDMVPALLLPLPDSTEDASDFANRPGRISAWDTDEHRGVTEIDDG
jgi:hypothetical protein